MENASKALLIAGAILLAILIISLGLMAYNNARNTVGSSNLSQQEITVFNSQWENYCGGNKTAAEIRTMFSAIIASNAAETNSGANRKVKVKYAKDLLGNDAAVDGTPTTIPIVPATKNYTVSPSYSNGLVTTLEIK